MWWSWVLGGLGLFGSWLFIRKNRAGWLVSGLAQVLWIVYGLMTWQLGFLPGSLIFLVIAARGWWRWGVDGQPQQRDQAVSTTCNCSTTMGGT